MFNPLLDGLFMYVRFMGEGKNYPLYNQFHNILRLFDVLLNFPFTTSETMGDYYL